MIPWFVTDLNQMNNGRLDDGGVFLGMEKSFFGYSDSSFCHSAGPGH